MNEKAKLKRYQMVEALYSSTNRQLMQGTRKTWTAYVDFCKYRRKRNQLAMTQQQNCETTLQRMYYYKYLTFLTECREEKRRQAAIASLRKAMELWLIRIYYGKLVRNVLNQKALRQRLRTVIMIMMNSDRAVLSVYKQRWADAVAVKIEQHSQVTYQVNRQHLGELQQQFHSMEARVPSSP